MAPELEPQSRVRSWSLERSLFDPRSRSQIKLGSAALVEWMLVIDRKWRVSTLGSDFVFIALRHPVKQGREPEPKWKLVKNFYFQAWEPEPGTFIFSHSQNQKDPEFFSAKHRSRKIRNLLLRIKPEPGTFYKKITVPSPAGVSVHVYPIILALSVRLFFIAFILINALLADCVYWYLY